MPQHIHVYGHACMIYIAAYRIIVLSPFISLLIVFNYLGHVIVYRLLIDFKFLEYASIFFPNKIKRMVVHMTNNHIFDNPFFLDLVDEKFAHIY